MASLNTISGSSSYPRGAGLPVQSAQQLTLKKKYELSEIDEKCLQALNKRLMSLANLQSYAGACQASESFNEEQEILFKFVKRSKYFENEKIAAANAISILSQTGYSFSRKNLRKVRIPGAYLEGANLVGADLRSVDLTGVTLSNATMSYAILDGARMERVQLSRWPMIKCEGPIKNLCLFPDEKRIIGSIGRTIYIWDLETTKETHKFEGHTSDIVALAFFQKGEKLVSVGKFRYEKHLTGIKKNIIFFNDSIRIWDLKTSKELCTPIRYPENVGSVAVFPDGRGVILNNHHSLCILDLGTGQVLKKLQPDYGSIATMILCMNGKNLISNDSANICIWNLETYKFKVLLGHTAPVTSFALFKDEKKLISGSQDTTIRFWDLETSQEIKKIETPAQIDRLGSVPKR
ncbi:MAG: pentapeptide repeat-containing protein, partial [Verrucomicrobia bacterium]|nr:pentapeptide repeat-containing protein [Verrucomicrobiota bacterium]